MTAGIIRVRVLIEGGSYLRKYGIHSNSVNFGVTVQTANLYMSEFWYEKCWLNEIFCVQTFGKNLKHGVQLWKIGWNLVYNTTLLDIF